MSNSDQPPPVYLEIHGDIIEEFDNEARRIIEDYLKRYNPGHDMSDHEDFTLVGISDLVHFQYMHKDKIEISQELFDKVVMMYMKLIPPDYIFLKTFQDDLVKSRQN